jgi:peptidoglycan/LPS O-acetylase OafA/YrhL
MHGGRFGAGDGLRALAAVGVVVFHASVIASASARQTGGPLWWLAGHLDVALYVFFVLSGYLITRSLMRTPGLRTYASHRLRRIVPAFWAALVITLVVEGTGGAGVAPAFLFAGTWPTLPQAWTLDAEMGFYLLLPLVAALGLHRLVSSRARVATLVCGLAAVAALSLLVRQAAGPVTDPLARSLPALLFAFVPGVALAVLEPLRFRPPRFAGTALTLAALALFALAALHGYRGAVGGALIALGAGAVVAGPLARQWAGGGTGAVLGSRPLRWVGERSYSLYLLHFLVLAQLAPLAHGHLPVLLGLGLPASIAAAAVLYELVEKPFMRPRTTAPALPQSAARAPSAPGG